VFLSFASLDGLSVSFMSYGGAAFENGTALQAGETLEYLSQPFFIASQPLAASLYIKGYFSGPASGVQVSFGRASCWSVGNPYQ
jgi:hypothetical protein